VPPFLEEHGRGAPCHHFWKSTGEAPVPPFLEEHGRGAPCYDLQPAVASKRIEQAGDEGEHESDGDPEGGGGIASLGGVAAAAAGSTKTTYRRMVAGYFLLMPVAS
jgi:hypothetical protein